MGIMMDRGFMTSPITPKRVLRNKPLEDMTPNELNDYILNMLEDWPCKLTADEKQLLVHELRAAVQQGRAMRMTRKEREQYLKWKKENIAKKEAYERELATPKLTQLEA